MKTVKLTCQNCGASLDVKENIAFCSYCGAKLVINDESVGLNYTYTKRDEARMRDSERKEKVRLQELENDENQKKREHKEQKWILIVWTIVMVTCIAGFFFLDLSQKPDDDEIEMPCSMSDYKGEHYEAVWQELEDLGFYHIETLVVNDLVTGWITKDGAVEKVSVNGDSKFEEGDIFPADAEVIVTYHTFKN